MSITVDSRVVEMRFDNKQFESNVQTSMSTLQKLKQSLNLTGASKGLEQINAAAKSNNVGALGAAAETVGLKFNAMWTIADQTLRNITNRVEQAGERMVKALTIEPIKTGLQEYETQIGAVQTILANTQSKGTNLNDVNRALDELNTYADKTIYNFTEMTRNIGTFTAAGVDLDKSVTSIKGIANLAAVSGSTSQQASTAMYQLSQALAAGRVSLMDWNSVVNAGMGGQVFQDALKRTATQMGHNVDEIIKKYGSFRESLTQGEWLTTEVLTETLTQLSGAYTEADLIAQGYTESQAKEILELAETAVNAATKVKTFTQLWDTLKESAQSGWTQTWELIIGDFEEAKSLWTGVSETIGGFINKTSEARNTMLAGALDNNWEKMISTINKAGIETGTFEEKLRSTMEDSGLDVDRLIEKHGSLEEVFRSGAVSSDILKQAVDGLSGSLVDLSSIEGKLKKGDTGEDVKKVQEALKGLGHDLGKTGADGIFGSATEEAVKAFQELQGLEVTGIIDEATIEALEKATEGAEGLSESCDGLISKITELGGREILIQSLKNIFEGLKSVIRPIGLAFRDVFPATTSEQLLGFIKGFEEFTSKLKLTTPQMVKVRQTFRGLFSVFGVGWDIVKKLAGGIWTLLGKITGLGGGVLDVTSTIGNWLTKFSKSAKETNIFGTAINKVVGIISSGIDKIKEFGSSLKESFKIPDAGGIFGFFVSLWNIVSKAGTWIINTVGSIGSTIAEAFGKGDIFEVLNTGLITGIALSVSKFTKSLSDGFDNAGGVLENVKGILDDVRGCFQAYQDQLKAGTLLKIAGAIGILAAAIFVISTIDSDALSQALGAISILFLELLGSLSAFSKIGGDVKSLLKTIPLLISLSVSVLILAAAMKVISTIDNEGVMRSIAGVGAMVAILVVAADNMDSKYKAITKFAGQMVTMSVAIAALAGVAKLLATMSWGELAKAGAGLVGITAVLVGAAKIMDSNDKTITKFAGQMFVMSLAISAVGLIAKMLGGMSWSELGRAGAGITGIVVLLVAAAKIMNGNDAAITKFAGQMFAMSIAIGALALVGKMISSMSWGELAKAGVGLLGITILLVSAAKIMDSKYGSITKFAGQMLVMSLGITVMAGALKMLAGLSVGQILTGLLGLAGALTIIGVAGLLLQPVVPAILALGGALALFGVSVVAIGAGLVMIGVGIGSIATNIGVGAVAIVGGLTSIILGLLNLVPEIAQIIGRTILEVAAILGDYAPQLAESFCKLIVGVVDSLATYGPQLVNSLLDLLVQVINGLADHMPTLIQAFSNLLGKVFEGVVAALNGADTTNLLKGIAAVGLMGVLTFVLSSIVSMIPMAMVGLLGVGVLIAEMALVFAAIGQLSKITGLEDSIAKAGDILNGIGKAIGSFISGIGEGLTSGLPEIGQNIADFMDKLALASANASGIKSGSFDGVADLMRVMGDIALTTVGTSISDIFTLGGTSMEKFQTDGVAFFNAMKEISAASNGITFNEESMSAVIGIATQLADLQSSLEPIGGVVSWFTGRDDLGTFGTNVGQFISSMSTALSSLDGASFNTEALSAVISASTELSSLQSSLEPIGGVVSWFSGRDDLGTFGINVGLFIRSMSNALSSLNGVNLNAEGLDSIINAATRLSKLQSSLEPIGGVISWFKGRDDLATFGTNIGQFISSMKTALSSLNDVTFNSEALTAIITAATELSGLQSSLESVGGVVDWFTGRDDLGTFGTNIGQFISSMKTALSGLDGVTFNSEALTAIITAATDLSGLQASLENIGGVVDWFTGRDDLGTFGTNVASFVGSMKTAFVDLGDTTINPEAMSSIITAATELAGLQSSLESVGGVVDWFTGRDDLGTFGDNIGKFGEAMGKLREGMGENGISDGVVTSVTNTGNALIALNDALPEEGFFDSKITMTDFSTYITDFSTAISDFSSKASEINSDGINTAINAAYRLKYLIEAISGIDVSGVEKFTGVGSGGVGADGPISDIADAMADFSSKVAGIDVSAVSTSVSAASRLKTLINSLAGVDASGVENFKIGPIGTAMKSYIKSVDDMDTGVVSSSISAANRLKNFINSLADIDTSGIGKFRISSIGSSIKDYALSVAGIDSGAISSSISGANKIKNFINSLAGLDTSGVSSFNSAVSTLGQTNVNGLVSAFSGAASKMSGAGTNIMNSLAKGMKSSTSSLTSAASSSVTSIFNSITSKASMFMVAGKTLMSNLATGISSMRGSISSASASAASSGASGIRGYWSSFYSAGSYLVSGFCSGISANTFRAAAQARAMANAAEQAAKAALKINSPSKVFAALGSGVVEGFVKGIDDNLLDTTNAVHSMADTAIQGFSGSMQVINDVLNSDIDSQPTIRPVVDLSEVSYGANAINDMLAMGSYIGVRTNVGAISAAMNRNSQNGANREIVSAIDKLRKDLGNVGNTYNNINGVTYDDGSNITDAVQTLVRAAKVERRR